MKTVNRKNFFVITGGPGMGKTSLIQEMERRNYLCIPETGRQVIINQMNVKGQAVPWKSPLQFAELMFDQDRDNFLNYAEQHQPVFFDRGIPDVMGYLELSSIQPSQEMTESTEKLRYHEFVFITPPWEEIYRNDSERRQSFSEAVETYEVMVSIYKKFGYQLLEIPKATVAQRADFLIKIIGF